MKSNLIAFACLLLCTLNGCSKQQPDNLGPVVIDGKSFASARLVNGLPELRGLQNPPLKNGKHAVIPLSDTLGTIYVCIGNGSDGKLFPYLSIIRPDFGLIRKLSIEDKGEILRTSSDLPFHQNSKILFPLDIRFFPSEDRLIYRWILTPDESTIPGGIPTAAKLGNVAVDVGKSFPDLPLTGLSGHPIRTKSFLGKITVINWWATWCKPCVDEIPGFNSLVDKFGSSASFVAIAQNKKEEVDAFLKQQAFRFVHTIGNDSTVRLLGSAVPRTVVLDSRGIIVFDKKGGSPSSHEEIGEVLQSIGAKALE